MVEVKWYAQHLTGRDLIPGARSDHEAIEIVNKGGKVVPESTYAIVRMERTIVATRPHNSKIRFKDNG